MFLAMEWGRLREGPPGATRQTPGDRRSALVGRKLVLIKHAAPEVDPDVPAERWHLSEKGRASCTPLAASLASHSPRVIVSSEEPKASETARLVAKELGVACETAPGLQ